MNTILGELGKSPKFCEYIKNIENKKSPIVISGLTDVGMAQMIAATKEFVKRPICIITYNEIQARKIVGDLAYFTDKIIYLPKKEIVTYDYVAESKDLPYERIEALNKIQEMRTGIVVTTAEAAIQKMISPKELYKNVLKFKIGDEYKLEDVKQKLIDLGYIRYDLIDGRGQFSVRGGIVDISVTEKTGIRIEFWGDEVDSIRYFNIISQRSTENIEKATIYPAHEYLLEKNVEEIVEKIKETVYPEELQEQINQDIETIKNENYISKIDRYLNSFYEKQSTILDYLSEKYIARTGYVYVVEAEKGVMQLWNMGIKNCVATCGKKISQYQINMLTRLSSHIIFCFDKDVTIDELNDIADKFLDCIQISVIVDTENLLEEKESPTDNPDKFKQLIAKCTQVIKNGK